MTTVPLQSFFLLTLALFIVCPNSPAAQDINTSIRDELIAMEKADQKARTKCTDGPVTDQINCFAEVSQRVDQAHAKRLTEIFDSIGFPDTAKVGREGMSAFLLLLQHMPTIELRERSLEPITRAFSNKEMPPMAYANFVDRLRVQKGKKQIYGSNFDLKDGRMVLSPTEDLTHLDKRRADIGLPTFAEYVRELKALYKMEVVLPKY